MMEMFFFVTDIINVQTSDHKTFVFNSLDLKIKCHRHVVACQPQDDDKASR